MKMLRVIVILLAFSYGWLSSSAVAQSSNAPAKSPVVVLPPNPAALPQPVQSLLNNYQTARDKYLTQQQALLQKLKGATEEQREEIRSQLQADRAAFLVQVTAIRQQLSQQIAELQVKIHNTELNRLINASQAGGGGGVHKGH
jgi:hypothetical protein